MNDGDGVCLLLLLMVGVGVGRGEGTDLLPTYLLTYLRVVSLLIGGKGGTEVQKLKLKRGLHSEEFFCAFFALLCFLGLACGALLWFFLYSLVRCEADKGWRCRWTGRDLVLNKDGSEWKWFI